MNSKFIFSYILEKNSKTKKSFRKNKNKLKTISSKSILLVNDNFVIK